MLVVETIAKIRRAYFVHGQPIKAICRELGVSRKVVRKVIRSEATEFRYEREAQPLPKIGPWSDKLDQLLLANEGKASRERLTLIRLFEELRGCGYGGGYDALRRYARRWSKERGVTTAAAYVTVTSILVGKERLYNRRFLQMCSHYLVDPVACTPASGWEKGQVENQVGLVRERFFTPPRLRFKNYDELNALAAR
jgi:transposase